MVSKIFVHFSDVTGRKVFRVESGRPFVLPTDMSAYLNKTNPFTPPPVLEIMPAPAISRTPDSGFLLSSIVPNLWIPPVSAVVSRPPYPQVWQPVIQPIMPLQRQQPLQELLAPQVSTPPQRRDPPVAPSQEVSPPKAPGKQIDAEAYTKEVIHDRIEYVLKKKGISRDYIEPIFDALYNQQIDRLYSDVYGEQYGGTGWERSELDNRVMVELYQATKVFRSFADTQLNNRSDAWVPRTQLEKRMSGEWFAGYVDETVEKIINRGELENREPEAAVRNKTIEKECCQGVPEPLQQAFKNTPNIDQFDPKAFEGLPALFELPRWDLERTSGREPRLNRLDVECETILSYDYPAVLEHRITMLKAEGGDEKDIKILEDLRDNIDKVLNDERYLSSSVWEANNTARHLALEGEKGLYRAYENSVRAYVQNLKMKPSVMEQADYLGLPDSMAKDYFTLINNPAFAGRLTEAMETYVMDKNSNLERYNAPKNVSVGQDTDYKERLLQTVVAAFGTK